MLSRMSIFQSTEPLLSAWQFQQTENPASATIVLIRACRFSFEIQGESLPGDLQFAETGAGQRNGQMRCLSAQLRAQSGLWVKKP
jgi:hypothetical protein